MVPLDWMGATVRVKEYRLYALVLPLPVPELEPDPEVPEPLEPLEPLEPEPVPPVVVLAAAFALGMRGASTMVMGFTVLL